MCLHIAFVIWNSQISKQCPRGVTVEDCHRRLRVQGAVNIETWSIGALQVALMIVLIVAAERVLTALNSGTTSTSKRLPRRPA